MENRILYVPITPSRSTQDRAPTYKDYISLKRNVLVEDDEKMSYFPYFGEEHRGGDWSGDIDNLFEDYTKQEAERNLEAETHARLYHSTDKLLEDVGSTKFDIVHHLLDNLPNHSQNKSAVSMSKDETAA